MCRSPLIGVADQFFRVTQRVFEVSFLGRPSIAKQRFKKQYRHATLDAKLTSARLKQVLIASCRGIKCLNPAAAYVPLLELRI